MKDISTELRDVVASLLADGKVDVVIGYEDGTLPLRTKACFVRDPSDAERLVWNPLCTNNIGTYVLSMPGKVGVVAKGCDARAIACAISEGQVSRENVTFISVPCEGVIDLRKLEEHLGNQEILDGELDSGKITVAGEGFSETYALEDLLCVGCKACMHRNAPISDIQIGKPSPELELADHYADVREFESLGPDVKRAHFEKELATCIRCFACRQACTLCYCPECFVDQTLPTWYRKTGAFSDTLFYHIVRALHLAGRCVGCGACTRACPVGIDLTVLNRKLLKDAKELFGHESGLDLEAAPLLSTSSPDDPQEFVK